MTKRYKRHGLGVAFIVAAAAALALASPMLASATASKTATSAASATSATTHRTISATRVMDADEPGKGQQCLTGDPDTKQIGSHRPGLQRLPPLLMMLAEVAVETASSPGIGRDAGRAADRSGPARWTQ